MHWNEVPHFAVLDWARHHHDVVIIDRYGTITETLCFEHTAAGWQQLRAMLPKYPALPFAIETSQGAAVEQLVAAGAAVYPINPKAAARCRERHAPSGGKDDLRDAWTMADALRLAGARWRALTPLEPRVAELRLLCRDEIALIEQRTALINQLQQALLEYYPAALEAFDDWTSPATWMFVLPFPTPAELVAAGRHARMPADGASATARRISAPDQRRLREASRRRAIRIVARHRREARPTIAG